MDSPCQPTLLAPIFIKAAMNSILNAFFIPIGSLCLGFSISFIYAAYFLYWTKKKHEADEAETDETDETETDSEYDINEIDEIKKNRLFAKQYFTEFEALDLHETEAVELTDKIVQVDTPAGAVILNYSGDPYCFAYYTDNKNVPYRVLETVARLFAITHDCKSICARGHPPRGHPPAQQAVSPDLVGPAPASAKQEKAVSPPASAQQEKADQAQEEVPLAEPPSKSIFATYKTYHRNAKTGAKPGAQAQAQSGLTACSCFADAGGCPCGAGPTRSGLTACCAGGCPRESGLTGCPRAQGETTISQTNRFKYKGKLAEFQLNKITKVTGSTDYTTFKRLMQLQAGIMRQEDPTPLL